MSSKYVRCVHCQKWYRTEDCNNYGVCPICLNLLIQRRNLMEIVAHLEDTLEMAVETNQGKVLKETIAKIQHLRVEISHINHILRIRQEMDIGGENVTPMDKKSSHQDKG